VRVTQPIRLSALAAAPAAGFEEPFGMLEACHERVQRMLALLARLREHVRTHGVDAQARQAARDVMRYFDLAAPQHHLDEELHVFPPLLAGNDHGVRALVQRLQRDHVEMDAGWASARTVLARIADAKVNQLPDEDEARLVAFAGLYDAHLRAEEQIAYPAAQRLLDEPARTAMGEEMMRRRGVK
jgi:hemerythrin-like domain-containing protein